MLRLALPLTLIALASPAAALESPPVCKALRGLADAARATHEPQRLALGGPAGALTCRPMGETPAGRAFCEAALAATAGDSADMFPWRVHECVDYLGAGTQKAFAPGDVGARHRKRLTRLTASLGGGARLDLQSAADRYDLVVWSAR
jgi:hypothetical protein